MAVSVDADPRALVEGLRIQMVGGDIGDGHLSRHGAEAALIATEKAVEPWPEREHGQHPRGERHAALAPPG